MDISKIKAEAQELELRHPGTDEPLGIFLTLLPMDDSKVKLAVQTAATQRLKSRNRVSIEEQERHSINICAAAVESWRFEGDTNFRGEKPDCTPPNVRKFVTELPWARRQIDDAIGNLSANFQEHATI